MDRTALGPLARDRIAVVGGGIAGSGCAIELARKGFHVDLFERRDDVLSGASAVNEGKIHQGFIYANDPGRRTANFMIEGALAFRSTLSRWIDPDAALVRSTPFIYAVHRDTMVPMDRLAAHFAKCCERFEFARQRCELDYLGRTAPASCRPLSAAELEEALDPAAFVGAFETGERSVDPHTLAAHLRAAVHDEPRISIHARAKVTAVTRRRGGFDLTVDGDGVGGSAQRAGPYAQVVNAAWEGRLAIDRSVGIEPQKEWSHRHKFGNRVLIPLAADDCPSVTCVLGPFGDIVNFGANGLFLSWYPVGMVDLCTDIEPPASWWTLTRNERMAVFRQSFAQWARLCPRLSALTFTDAEVEPASGAIFAWGASDIDDPHSMLHSRYEIGIHSVDGYHSVNTGKFTLAPLMAQKAAERVIAATHSGRDRRGAAQRPAVNGVVSGTR